MKKLLLLPILAALLAAQTAAAQSVGIGTPSPNPKAALDLTSTTQGLLIPRLTAAQRTAIATPPQGLMVYQTDGTAGGGLQTGFWYYAGTGGWVLVNPTGTADNLGNHTATQNLNLTDKLLVGGTAGAPGSIGLSVSSTGQVGIGTTAPFSQLANTTANIVGADGYGVGSKSLTWNSGLAGYTGAFYNATAGAGQNGLAVKVAGANATATALDVSQGTAGTAGASLLTVQANGYVGLGTANPAAILEVRRGLAPDGTAAFYGTDRTSHFSYGTTEDTYLRGGKATANVYINDNGGRVGIGTAAPFSMLANTATNIVGADGYGVGEKSLTWSSNLAGYAGAVFNANPGMGQNGLAVKVAGANATATALDVSQGTAGTAGASLLTVRANGYVGLGTAAPTATLEVRRGLAPDGTAAFYGTDRISHFSYGTTEDTYLRGGKATSNVYINDTGGNVGVGTSTVPQRLTVAGTVLANNSSTSTAAVIGNNASIGIFATGVQGTAAGSGKGVQGMAGVNGFGVAGSADGSTGHGVDGFALDGRGVYGSTDSGVGVYAEAVAGNDGIGLVTVASGANPAAIITQNGSGLALDVRGGAVRTAEVRTPSTGTANMLAIGYGEVSATGFISNSSGNFTVAVGPFFGAYTVSFPHLSSVSLLNALVLITPIYGLAGTTTTFANASGASAGVVNVSATKSNGSHGPFKFVVYLP